MRPVPSSPAPPSTPEAEDAGALAALLAGCGCGAISFSFDGCPMTAVRLDDWTAWSDDAAAMRLLRRRVSGRLRLRGEVFVVLSDVPVEPAPDLGSVARILTQRELKVTCLIAEGLTDKEIARQLGISAYTVREHCRRACAKLNVTRRSALVKRLFAARPPGG